jgi:hypothetical protein
MIKGAALPLQDKIGQQSSPAIYNARDIAKVVALKYHRVIFPMLHKKT